MSKDVFLVAGEASGEQLGAALIEANHRAGLDLRYAGVVGPRLQALGVEKRFDGDVLAVMGFVEVLGRLFRIRHLLRQIDASFAMKRPDLVVLIDHPAFNLRVAALAKARGIPVLYYVSPQIWAWRAHRIHKIARLVDHMMVLFPFEAALYREAGVPVTVVTHPLVESTRRARENFPQKVSETARERPRVALLPGSREGEIQRLTPRLALTAKALHARNPEIEFVVPLARAAQRPLFEHLWRQSVKAAPWPAIQEGNAQAAILSADVVVSASGTATLEAALLGRPGVVVYAVNPVTYAIARRLVRIPYVALPNILLQTQVYPEFIQEAFKPAMVADQVLAILDEQGGQQRALLSRLPDLLRGESQDEVARVVKALLHEH